MFGKVPEDSFQNIFDLSFDSEENKCVLGSRGLDFLSTLSPNSLNSYNNNNNNHNNNNNSVSNKNTNANHSSFEGEQENSGDIKRWRDGFLSSPSGSQQEELEQAFAKLYSNRGQPSSSAQDAFASSFFPFSLNSLSDKNKSCDQVDNGKKLLYSAALATAGTNNSCSSASSICSSSSSAISCPSADSLPASKVNPSRYKTELCRPYQENGSCKYGEKCQFAHGLPELRTVNRHPKYKTDLCRTYHSVGFCPYGPRCHFIHSLEELTAGTPNNGQRSSTPSTPTSSSASTNEIAAAIAALRQLPIYTPERVSAPPGFGPRPVRRPLEGLGLSGLNSSGSSGVSSVSSLSPSMLEDANNDSLPRLPVFSRFH